VNANYGLAPQVVHPQQVLDVAKAIKYAVDHAPEWGGDPDRIFLMGHSAGAHLVDLVATNQRFLQQVGVKPTSIKGVISLDTASLDLLKRTSETSFEGQHVGAMIEQAFGKDPEMLKDGSPTLNIHKGSYYPPFLMFCGERRRSCLEQHQEFARQLKGVGAKVVIKPVPLSHRDINLAAGNGGAEIFKASKAFIESGGL
jgi:acetyl esterase/lipase